VQQYALIQFNMWSAWEKILQDSAGDLFQSLASRAPIDVSLDQFFQSYDWTQLPSGVDGMPKSGDCTNALEEIRSGCNALSSTWHMHHA
jgi:hypothetical protein